MLELKCGQETRSHSRVDERDNEREDRKGATEMGKGEPTGNLGRGERSETHAFSISLSQHF